MVYNDALTQKFIDIVGVIPRSEAHARIELIDLFNNQTTDNLEMMRANMKAVAADAPGAELAVWAVKEFNTIIAKRQPYKNHIDESVDMA